MGRRRLYCATLRARRTKRLDQRHEIAQDRDETLLVLETVSRPRPRDRDRIPVIQSNLHRFYQFFFTGRFLSKFSVKWILKIPPHLAYVATLPCDILMSAKHAINDKLPGSVATYFRCSGIVNNQIKKGLLLSVSSTWPTHC